MALRFLLGFAIVVVWLEEVVDVKTAEVTAVKGVVFVAINIKELVGCYLQETEKQSNFPSSFIEHN